VNYWTLLLEWPQRTTPGFKTISPSAQAKGTLTTPTVSFDYCLLLLKPEKQHSRSLTAPSGRTPRRSNPECNRIQTVSDVMETIEHLLCECEYYSEPLWSKLAESLTMLFNDISPDRVPRVELGQANIILNIPHPSLSLYVYDKISRNAILHIADTEVKRDIILRKMNVPPSAQQITDPQRLAAHLDSTIRRLCSYLQYIGFVKYTKAANLLLRLQEFNLA
jgi:hypothetical protein